MNKFKAIVLDIDGTLYSNNKEITPKTKEALLEAQRNGVKLVLASGRPTNGLLHIAEELDMNHNHGLLISYNGSKVIDCNNGNVLFNQGLTLDEMKRVLTHVSKFDGVTAMVDKGADMIVTDMDGYMVEYETSGGGFRAVEDKDLHEHIDFEANKILTSAIPERLQEVADDLAAPFKDELSCMFTAPFYFEYTAKNVDKGKTMDVVFKELGIKAEEVISFGDAHNDISMLSYSGVGVAMENAAQEVKDIADYITLDNDSDGIAIALEKYNVI